MVLANQTGAALACVALAGRGERCSEELDIATSELAAARRQLRNRSLVHETIEAALGSGGGEQAITDALHELTSLPIALEDRFGNLRCWSGPGQPTPYPEPVPQRRQRQLAVLAARHGPMRMKERVEVLVAPRGEQLGVLAIIDPRLLVTDDDIFALHFACTLLGYELSHQRSLVEREESVRRELFEDLLAGTDDEGAVARAEALGHDLRRPHYVIVAQSAASADSLAAAAARGAAALNLATLRGRRGQLIVLLAASRPDPRALHRAMSEQLGTATCAIGIGARCDTPSGIPQSFTEAQRALTVRLHSAMPVGASAFEDLGFYRLIDAAHTRGAVEDFVREWLGPLMDYDAARKSELVLTLSKHLESGGNYDESAKTLHIHRSTLRYRLARIGELTGYDLRDVDVRFNLHAATRAWRFLHPKPARSS
ncbi:MAG: helix-turn-helix domain-containing protein [Mycobacterium kyogaense]|uniref:PucR family transcriptional regulator n=1 Tax=Mycobacterium kyogaense TaxID=2212479 RepID=UPI002FF707EA